MGTKYSRQCPITYEEAVKRVTEKELTRLKDAFKRAATNGSTVTKATFVKEVLGDTFPLNLAEHLFQACGGNAKGLTFKELLCVLVLLTSGTKEEKIRFIFLLYANEAGTHVVKNTMVKLVKETQGGYLPPQVADCFIEKESVAFEDFAAWLLTNEDATSLTKWLLKERNVLSLSNELDTPTFYQTLSGVTHLEESDIIELEKRYWILKSYSCSGKFDLETLTPLVSPPLPLPLCRGLFNAFDENRDNHIDFKEMACGVSACCRGPRTERQKFCFKVFDSDRDGFLNRQELETMITSLLFLRKENISSDGSNVENFDQKDVDRITDEILSKFENGKGSKITMEDYLVWTVDNHLPFDFTNLLFQICHIVLGLKPSTRLEEGEIIRGWITREKKRGFRVGQFWYLINMDWWHKWNKCVDCVPSSVRNGPIADRIREPSGHSVQSLPKDVTSSESDLSSNLTSRTSSSQLLDHNNAFNFLPNLASRSGLTTLLHISTDSTRSASSSPNHSPRPTTASLYPQRPPAIDNSSLIIPYTQKIVMLTGEGGRLRKNAVLMCGKDFEMVPEAIWRALVQWYGGSPALPRQVIQPRNGDNPELELYPITLQLYRHQVTSNQTAATFYQNHHLSQPSVPKRYLAYVAAFSRLATINQVCNYICVQLRLRPQDARLWTLIDDNNLSLVEEEALTLEQLSIGENTKVLVEVRNKDQTWPEEMSSLILQKSCLDRTRQHAVEKGLTGLNNLGNTCFMNAAVQCVSNTTPLTIYFNTNMHLYELNRINPLGMKGHIAKRYGDLVQDLWSGTSRAIAPLKLRYTIGKCAPRFNGFQQHDCQELLAFLLDGLHEDLNRVHDKPYTELKDSDGRSDVVVAQEAWENHILRNKSIIVDLFHGQLKSQVTCKVCGHTSVRFDPFNYLSLPLPMESFIHVEIVVITLDGQVPVKYGLRLNQDTKYRSVKEELSKLCSISYEQLLLAEVTDSFVTLIPSDETKLRNISGRTLFAYQVTPSMEMVYEDKDVKEQHSLTEIQRSTAKKFIQPVKNEITDSDKVIDGCATTETFHSSLLNHVGRANISSVFSDGLPSSMTSSTVSNGSQSEVENLKIVVTYHRKTIRQDVYFLLWEKTRPSIFGQPIILPINDATTGQNLYELVWNQVSRLVSPLPPFEGSVVSNHAQDCDDSLGYEYPFALKVIQKDGLTCARCPWFSFCRGCKIECNSKLFSFWSNHIAIDWDPTALHLRYQTAQEKMHVEHETLATTRKIQSEPIDLNSCLDAFTTEEELGEDEKYYCSKCKTHQLASKKLQIWRLPPILIVHLKRFQLVNGRWVKSHKKVRFPYEKLCPALFLASVPKLAVLNALTNPDSQYYESNYKEDRQDSSPIVGCKKCNNNDIVEAERAEDPLQTPDCSCNVKKLQDLDEYRAHLEKKLRSSSVLDAPNEPPQDFHQHQLKDSINPFVLNYNLYALSCHTGILGGGHYVCFAKNTSRWYCFNDSSCKEIKEENIDSDSAYILFYEREGIDYNRYLPNMKPTYSSPDVGDLEDEMETDFKKVCNIL